MPRERLSRDIFGECSQINGRVLIGPGSKIQVKCSWSTVHVAIIPEEKEAEIAECTAIAKTAYQKE